MFSSNAGGDAGRAGGAGAGGASRITTLLETLRQEIEQTANEANMYKQQRDEYERKLEAQLQELSMLQQALMELERAHLNMNQAYEDEIIRLRRQIEASGGKVQPPGGVPSLGPVPNQTAALPPGLLVGGFDSKSVLAAGQPMAGGAGGMHTMAAAGGEPALGGVAANPGGLMQAARAVSEGGVKPVDSKGKPMDDWSVVQNPTATQRMTLKLEHVLEHDSVVCCVRFSSEGRYFATGCNKAAALFDVATGERLCMFTNEGVVETQAGLDNLPAGDSYVRSVCFSPDSKFLVAGAEDRTIKIWDLQHRRLRHSLQGHTKDIYSVDCTNDSRFIASGSGDKRAKLWDVATGQCVRTFGDESGPHDGVTSVAVSPDGKYLAAGSLDKVVRLWNTETGQLAEQFDGHGDSVYSVSFSPDGSLLATGSLDKTVRLWDISSVGSRSGPKCRFTFNGHKDFVLSVAFAPQGTWLISGSKDRSVQFWDPRLLSEGKTEDGPSLILQGHQNSVISLAHSPVGCLFATGSGDKSARIWSYSPEA